MKNFYIAVILLVILLPLQVQAKAKAEKGYLTYREALQLYRESGRLNSGWGVYALPSTSGVGIFFKESKEEDFSMVASAHLEWESPFHQNFTYIKSWFQSGGGVLVKMVTYPNKPKFYPYFDVQVGVKMYIKSVYLLFTGGSFVVPFYQGISLMGGAWFGWRILKNSSDSDMSIGIQIAQTPKPMRSFNLGIGMRFNFWIKKLWKKRSI